MCVRQYCQLLEKGNRCSKCPPNCADTCTIHPVQQGEVSSTESPSLSDHTTGVGGDTNTNTNTNTTNTNTGDDPDDQKKNSPEISAYFEAVEHYISSSGWALLKIRSNGHIDTCTENIEDLIRFKRTDLQQNTIFTYLHPADHVKLSPLLSTMSLSVSAGWDSLSHTSARQANALVEEDSAGSAQVVATKRAIKTRLRMLCKYPLHTPRNQVSVTTAATGAPTEPTYTEVVFFATPFCKSRDKDKEKAKQANIGEFALVCREPPPHACLTVVSFRPRHR